MDNSTVIAHKDITPSADDSSKENHNPSCNNKKRKRHDKEDEISNPFFRPFAVTPHAQQTNKSHTFVPIAHLPRADLPLVWLDHGMSPKKSTIQPGALLNARLQQVHSNSLKDHALTLIARLAPNGGLYVFERVGEDVEIYVSCSLQPWVSESRIIHQSLGAACSKDDDLRCLVDHQSKMTTPARQPPAGFSHTPKQPKDRRGALARMSILPAKEGSADVEPSVDIPQMASPRAPTASPAVDITEIGLDIDQLRVQYLETLYVSKTSLAYLAKGPLARARNLALTSSGLLEKLLDFYQDSIISTKKLDLKYKESVNKIFESEKSARQTEAAEEHPRKKASRKKKMGKDALYPGEEVYVQRCWLEREVRNLKSISAQSQAQEQRKLVSDLRTRETKMQVLLILEVLALEALPANPSELALHTDVMVKTKEQATVSAAVLVKTPTKSKAESKSKFRNYSSQLDTLVDRLCIWHTVGIDDMLESPEKKAQEAQNSSSRTDQLVDFCAEAIVPFYASRLPEQCKMICKKLGGPTISPERPRAALTKSASMSRLPPGAAIKRRPQAVPRKTLERVLSDDRSMRHASPPVLARSVTAPLVPNLKREPSEPSQRPGSRGALHKSVSFSNREIDLDADARIQEAKRRKLARVSEQKKELDAAIAALKKPNRTVAAKVLMDEMESRNPNNTTRKQTVHIAATPKRVRAKASSHHQSSLPPTPELDVSIDDPVIPSSTVRPRGLDQWRPAASAKKRAVLFAIHETPARPLSAVQEAMQKPVSRLNFVGLPKTDNVSSDSTLVESTPATNRLQSDLRTQVETTPMRMSKSMRPVLFTPLKKTEVRVEDAFRDAPVIPADAGKAMDRVMGGGGTTELSVYDALGWNDDYDL